MAIRIPGFFGYLNSYRSLLVNQDALNTINHNIANVNTAGYSRQSVDLSTMNAYPPATISNEFSSGFIGQGVQVKGVTRTHDNYLDNQVRVQNTLYSYQKFLQDTLQQMEGILGGVTENGIHDAMADFFSSAQALSSHPDDLAVRTGFIQSAKSMLDIFQQQMQQMQDLRTNLVGIPGNAGSFDVSLSAITVNEVNAMLTQVANINSEILTTAASGASPNDLLDRRDQLLGELAKRLNIEVDYKEGNQVNVRLGNTYLVRTVNVINSLEAVENDGSYGIPINDEPTVIRLSSDPLTAINNQITGGRLGGILKMGSNSNAPISIYGLMTNLNTLFNEMAVQFNTLQAAGRDLDGNLPVAGVSDLIFTGGGPDVFNYSVNANIINNPRLIAAAIDDPVVGGFAGVGDGRNALAMAALESTSLVALNNTNVNDYFNTQLSNLGTDTKASIDSAENLNIVVKQLEQRRESVQGVNLEEEMINMLRFQRSFEASAKILNTIDKTMDLIINKML